MKPLIPILVVATTSLAVASVQFAQQASSQRQRADAEMSLRQKQETRVAELERSQARLERELQTVQGATGAPPPVEAPVSASTTTRSASASVGRVTSSAAFDRVGVPPPPAFFGRAGPRMMESPAARKFMQTRMKASLRRMHEDVGPALGLSPEKASQLIDLLAEQQSRAMVRPVPGDDPRAVGQSMRELQQKNTAELNAFLGADKVDDWQKYQSSLPDRMQLSQVREQIESAGAPPMTDDQRTELLTAMSEERERFPQPTYSAGVPQEEMAAQMSQWQNDYDKALLARAKQVLSTEQYNSYKEYQEWQAEMRNNNPFARGGGLRMAAPIGGVSSVGAASSGLMPAPMVTLQSESAVLMPVRPPPPENK